jgi:hypothetical protein
MSDDHDGDQDDAQTMMMYLAGMSKLVKDEFGGSINGTRVILPKDASKWMPELVKRFGLTGKLKQLYGEVALELPGISFIWRDQLSRLETDENA